MPVNLKDMEKTARDIGHLIAHGIAEAHGPKKVGFALLLFDFGGGGHMTYISNGDREDMLKALKEAIDVIENKRDNPPL